MKSKEAKLEEKRDKLEAKREAKRWRKIEHDDNRKAKLEAKREAKHDKREDKLEAKRLRKIELKTERKVSSLPLHGIGERGMSTSEYADSEYLEHSEAYRKLEEMRKEGLVTKHMSGRGWRWFYK